MKGLCQFFILGVIMIGLSSCGGEKKAENSQPKSTGDSLIDQINLQIENDPTNADLLYNRAKALYEKEEYEAAVNDLKSAISIDSLNPSFYHLLSDTYMDYFQSRKSLDAMEEASRIFPERIPTLLKLSETQLILSQHANSIRTVNEILRMEPQNSEAYFMLGLNFRETGDLDRAINSFQTAVEINPELIDGWIVLGELYERKGTGDPLRYYDNALLVDPENPNVLHSKAFYLQNNGDIPGALELYQQINEVKPQYADAYINAGILYIEQDSFERAFEQMNILIGVAPENPYGYFYRAMIHKAYGNFEAAETDLTNAKNLSQQFPAADKELEIVKQLIIENPTKEG